MPPWCSLVPGRFVDEASSTDWTPPIRLNSAGELNIDLSALTLVDNVIMDKSSTDILLSRKHESHAKLRETVKVLMDNGFAVTSDLSGQVLKRNDDLMYEGDNEMRRWEYWLPTIQSTIRGWIELRGDLKRACGPDYNEHDHAPGGIRDYLIAQGEPFTHKNIEKIERIVLSNRKMLSFYEMDVVKQVVRFYIEYAFANIVARSDINEPFFDWSNVGRIYIEKMKLVGLGARQAELRCATEFFSAMHIYEVTSAQQLLAIRSDARLSEFRALISDAAKTGTRLDDDFVLKVNDRMAGVISDQSGYKRVISVAGGIAGVIEAFALGAPIVSAAAALATSATQEVAGATLDKYLNKDMDWLFCLRDAARHRHE